MADSLREQIFKTKQNYETYFDNIRRIRDYKFREFLLYADCIGNSLCEYDITTNVAFINNTAIKFDDTWQSNYAKKLYERCINLSETKLKTEPTKIDWLDGLSCSYNNLAILQQNQLNDYKSAESNLKKAIVEAKKIIRVSNLLRYHNLLAGHYNNLAVLQSDYLNEPKLAVINYYEALKIRKIIIQKSVATEYLNDLGRTYFNIANLQKNSLFDFDSADKNYSKAIEIGEQIKKYNPKSDFLYMLSSAYNNLALMQMYRKDYKQSEKNIKEAIKIRNSIKDEYIEYLVNWAASKSLLAQLYIATDKPTEARAIVDEIKPQAEELLEEYPDYGYLKKVYGWIEDTESDLNQ